MPSFVAVDHLAWTLPAGPQGGAPGGQPATRRPLLLAAVAAAHLGLLIALAHALRGPVVPPALAALTVQLMGAEAPKQPAPPAPAPTPLPAPPRPAAPPLALPLPTVVLADVPPAPRPAEPTLAVAPAAAQPPAPERATAPMTAQAVVPTPPPAPAAPVPDRQVSINQVSISQVAYLVPPVLAYPLAARRLREQGQVLVRVRVDEQGRPEQAVLQQSSGSPRLDEAALAAVAATRFKPYREGSVARPFWVVMPLVFSLEA